MHWGKDLDRKFNFSKRKAHVIAHAHFKILRYFLTNTTGEKLRGTGGFAACFVESYWEFLPRRLFCVPSSES